ncbi:MAG: cobaltochelatase subunit CobN [Pseudomonadota bacterium]
MATILVTVPLRAQGPGYLLVLVSQRNAETVAEAAAYFAERYPNLTVLARSDVQIREYDEAELDKLIGNSRGVLGMGLYGPSVIALKPVLSQSRKPQLFMSSDHNLVGLSQMREGPLFDSDEQLRAVARNTPESDFAGWLSGMRDSYPSVLPWIEAQAYWQGGGSDNSAQLFAWFYGELGANTSFEPPKPQARLRWLYRGSISDSMPRLEDRPVVAVVDHAGGGRPGDRALLRELCQAVAREANQQCLTALAYWGEAGVQAVDALKALEGRLSSVIMLQDFVVGGGEGRQAVVDRLKQLNVPVIKAIKLRDRTEAEWLLSADGLAYDKVYYQVAMPELQGASQPLVVAVAGRVADDALTGIRVQAIEPQREGLGSITERIARWQLLREKDNAEKRVAVIYYNHPPGRHNIGADNLDVPASLWQILNALEEAGYNTGTLPESQDALLELMQARGVNLPRDAGSLARMSSEIKRADLGRYKAWFAKLPPSVKSEMEFGPFGLLKEQILEALAQDKPELGQTILEHTMEEMHHLLEGVDHPGRERALDLIEQLETCYGGALSGAGTDCVRGEATDINAALGKIGIEGLAGWGVAPGAVMTVNGDILLPGMQFGNVFIGPQPPRGWEINEELLHANLAFPPPHQYLAFYHFLKEDFKADALVHLGRHSTYEFLPRRSVGLAADDYARVIGGDIPGVYPYIVDGVGEGIQAKRRGLAVMVDHLTPPLQITPLYDGLLQLRQLVESFEAMHGSKNTAVTERLVGEIRAKVDALELTDELAEAMSAELAVMGISFEQVDDDLMVHEVGHYLTDLQERFMPLGLHVYGKDWDSDAVTMMLDSMSPEDDAQRADWQLQLTRSPEAEMQALLRGLSGGYIEPGQGNDPIRSPASLPTGRNFFALDSSLIPSRVAWELGSEMARDARAEREKAGQQTSGKREAMVLWASDVVRDEGVMIAFGLDMLGIEPVWNSRGLVTGLKRQSVADAGRVRRDVVFTTSGLFRDLYGQQMRLLNRATLLALDASADTIIRDYPALTLALTEALSPLEDAGLGGDEALAVNQVAAHWVKQASELLGSGMPAERAGVMASYRVFGDPPGSYGAGINRLAERSGAWEHRSELAEVYIRRLGHSYGMSGFGVPAQAAFERVLVDVENTYFGRSSNLYGLIDNNDAFDYLGGLSLSVETLAGAAPNNYVLDHSDPTRVRAQPLGRALRQELRGRFLNPEWLKGLMVHGYAGARTMGSEFVEYLWGWQITNPTLVGDWAWEEVKAVYIDDRYDLQLDDFLAEGSNAYVKSNMIAVMLVAVHKGFWQAERATVEQLAAEFAALVAENGLPGSGHTDPDQPMLPWLERYLSAEDWQALARVVDTARPQLQAEKEQHRITELTLEDTETADDQNSAETVQSNDAAGPSTAWLWWALALVALAVCAGYAGGVRQARLIRG